MYIKQRSRPGRPLDLTGADYAQTLYNWLVENIDGDVTDDLLIDPTSAERVNGKYVYLLKKNIDEVPFNYNADATDQEIQSAAISAAQAAMTDTLNAVSANVSAVFDAFDRDHPEVFWLSGQRKVDETSEYSMTYSPDGTGTVTYTQNFYLLLNSSDFDIRAQIVTFLWRSQKSPEVLLANPFTDVDSKAYYIDAVLWAAKNGITSGTSADTFSPDVTCTRAQIVTFLYRCLGDEE